MFTSTICSIGPFLLKEMSTFLIYIGFSIFFNLNLCFLTNSKLITSSVAPLSNNASTMIPSCISILSSPIFTVTSLKRSPLSRLHEDIFSITLLSIANLFLLLLRSSWDPLDFHPHLNYCYCPLSPFSYSYLFSNSYSVLPYVQNSHMHNSSCCSYLYPWHMGFFKEILSLTIGILPSPHLSFPHLPSEQALLLFIVEMSPVSLAKLEAMAIFAFVPPDCSTLEPMSH